MWEPREVQGHSELLWGGVDRELEVVWRTGRGRQGRKRRVREDMRAGIISLVADVEFILDPVLDGDGEPGNGPGCLKEVEIRHGEHGGQRVSHDHGVETENLVQTWARPDGGHGGVLNVGEVEVAEQQLE